MINLILTGLYEPARGFSSITVFDAENAFLQPGFHISGYVHGDLTRKSLNLFKLNSIFVEAVADANWHVDWDSSKIDFFNFYYGRIKLPYRPNHLYKPDYHFDRNKEDGTGGLANQKAFSRGVQFVRSQRVIIIDGLNGRNNKTMTDVQIAMGHALHAIQDFFSHSNVIDLSQNDYLLTMAILKSKSGPIGLAPSTIMICGFDKNFNKDFEINFPDSPCSTTYGHDACAKDDPFFEEGKRKMKPGSYEFNPEKTKFTRAYEAADIFSVSWIQEIKNEVGPINWKKIEI